MNEFFFVRHGETEANAKGILHDLDLPLNTRGVEQARSIRNLIADLSIETICHSPLARAKETAQIISDWFSAFHVLISDLHECNDDVWLEMIRIEEESAFSFSMETKRFVERSVQGIQKALTYPGPVLVVAHGGIHWAFCHYHAVSSHDWKIHNCIPLHFKKLKDNSWEGSFLI